MPTAICENDAAEKDKTTIANNSHRTAARFVLMPVPLIPFPRSPVPARNAIVPQKTAPGRLRSSLTNTELWSMLLEPETIWNVEVGDAMDRAREGRTKARREDDPVAARNRPWIRSLRQHTGGLASLKARQTS